MSKDPNIDEVDSKILNMIKNFRSTSKFKNEVMKILVNQLTEKEIQGLKEFFQQIDKDNSGMITVDELAEVMKKSGNEMCQQDLEKIMQTMSTHQQDKDG